MEDQTGHQNISTERIMLPIIIEKNPKGHFDELLDDLER
jgi:hypothetical protein